MVTYSPRWTRLALFSWGIQAHGLNWTVLPPDDKSPAVLFAQPVGHPIVSSSEVGRFTTVRAAQRFVDRFGRKSRSRRAVVAVALLVMLTRLGACVDVTAPTASLRPIAPASRCSDCRPMPVPTHRVGRSNG